MTDVPTPAEPLRPEEHQPLPTLPHRTVLPTSMTAAELDRIELPETRFILPGIIPVGLTGLAGRPKRGKSWMALGLSLSLATGGTYLDRQLERGDVLYFATEDSWKRVKTRSQQLVGGAPLPDNLRFVLDAPKLQDGFVEVVEAWADAADNPVLVVVDTLGSITPQAGRRQDVYTFMTDTLRGLQHLARDRDLAVMLIHHTRKPIKGDGGDPFDDVLGSTAITGVLDTTIVIQRPSHSLEGTMSVTGRDIDEVQMGIKLDTKTGLWLPTEPDPLMGLTFTQRDVYAAVAAGNRTLQAIADASDTTYGNVRNVVARLTHERYLDRVKPGEYVVSAAMSAQIKGTDNADSADSEEENETESLLKRLFGEED